MKTEKKNLRHISIVVTAQTKGNLERLAAVCGYSEIGRVVDKLTRDLVIDLGNSVPHPDRFNCPYVNRIGQLTVSVLLNRFARKEHRA